MIEFKKVTKRFGTKTVLNQVSFTIQEGEIVFILGKSGMGKSVLLKNIVGLLRPEEGEIWVDGERVDHFSEEQLGPVRKKCGMVFQFPALLDSLTVYENVKFGLEAHRLAQDDAAKRKICEDKLALVNLRADIFDRYPSQLSFGIQKRVAIARTLAVEPGYLLFDEPTTSLDPIATNAINQLISRLSRTLKVTSLVVSHDMRCALEIADRILFFDQGQIAAQGTPNDLLSSDYPLVQEFMREAKETRA